MYEACFDREKSERLTNIMTESPAEGAFGDHSDGTIFVKQGTNQVVRVVILDALQDGEL